MPSIHLICWFRVARHLAVVAGVFTLLTCGMLVANAIRLRAIDPAHSPALAAMKTTIAEGGNPQLVEEFRRLDARYNRDYAARAAFARHGYLLLLVGVALFLVTTAIARIAHRRLPDPTRVPYEDPFATRALGRTMVVVLGVTMGGVMLAMAATPPLMLIAPPAPRGSTAATVAPPPLAAASARAATTQTTDPGTTPVVPAQGTPAAPTPAPASSRDGWPIFRGPRGTGWAMTADAPTAWDGASGKGVRWKSAVPLPGRNSPVVWGNRLFVSGADERNRAVYCYDTETGKLLWTRQVTGVPGSPAAPPKVSEDTGYAAPTMATDGTRAYAIFANGDLVAVDYAGKIVWARSLGMPESMYGYAASLALSRDRVIVQYDMGHAASQGKSRLLAIDAATGKTVWEVAKRPVPNSWSTPLVLTVGGREQIVAAGNPWVIGYDAAGGTELWRAECLGGDVAPTPTAAGGLVIACQQGYDLVAIKPGAGTITESGIVWRAADAIPDITSPAANDRYVITVETYGTVVCYALADGAKRWEHALDKEFNASPVIAGDRLYLLDTEGVMHILAMGDSYRLIATAPLGEECRATPAFVGGRIYLRGKDHLYCVGAR